VLELLAAVRRSIRSAATCISRRYFQASSRVEQGLFLLYALLEIRVGEAGRRDIDLMVISDA
jgi:hypothetical protein